MLKNIQAADKRNLGTGLLYLVLGAATAWISLSYKMGSASDMGPGYFPFWLGILLVLIGIAVLLRALRAASNSGGIEKVHWRALAVIIGSVLAFGLALEYAGFVVATLALIGISGLADPANKWRTVLISAVFLAVMGALIFVVGLKIDVPLWPPVLTDD